MDSPTLTALATAVLHVERNPERVLEIGCGEGEGVLFLAREFPGARIRGVDTDETAIRAATGRLGLDPEGRIAFKLGKRRRLPFPDDFFDLVAQRHGVLRPAEAARVLHPNGHLAYVLSRRRGLARPVLPLRLRFSLRRAGFETVASGQAAERLFYVGHLTGSSGAEQE